MDSKKETWTNNVFQSMKGSKRAKPRPDLYAKIKAEVALSKVKDVSLMQWRYTAAAAILVLLMNTLALVHYTQRNREYFEESETPQRYDKSIISSYQIYE